MSTIKKSERAASATAPRSRRRRPSSSSRRRDGSAIHRGVLTPTLRCPEETAPRFFLRDRDKIYGERFRRAIEVLGIEEIVTAARSPWQNPYAERLTTGSGRQFHRVLMPKTKNHVYFEVDEARGLVIVHAIWGALRGRGPKL